MTLDILTLILSAVVVLMALLTPMMSPFFRRLHHSETPAGNSQPPVTVLLVSNGDHIALDEHLPIYLTQVYGGNFEVVVVTEKADIETENVLKRYSHDPHLYHTFVPESSRYMSKSKLAITLGVKAAKNEWIILTDPRCKPSDSHWLEAMAPHLTDDHSLVMGYCGLADEARPFHRFHRLHTALYLLREAQNERPYRTNCMHVAFRKSEFMKQSGFLEYLKFSIGEYDFLVNKYGRGGRTDVAYDSSTWLTENALADKTWQNQQVYFRETGRHLEGGSWVRLLHSLDQWALHLGNLLFLGIGIFAGLTSRWILLGVTVLALLLTIVMRTLNGRKALRMFDVNIPTWKIYFYELSVLRHTILTHLRYEYADKNDFISHKV